jgi:cytochrome c-type biogenesis protein CcmH/NrfG
MAMFPEAIEMYLTALHHDPRHVSARYHLGLMYQRNGQYSNAR